MRSCVKWLSTLYIYQVTFIEEEPGELYVSGQKKKKWPEENFYKKVLGFFFFFFFLYIKNF